MTMPYSPSRAIYEGNSAATRFPFSFKVWGASQLVVTLTSPDGLTTGASGWTADIGAAGGEITYLHQNAPLPDGWRLAITRNMPFTQEVNLVSASRFDPQVIEDALDQATAERQQTLEMMQRAVILPATSSETPQDVVLAVYAARDDATAAASSASGSQSAAAASAGAAADSANTAAQNVEAATAKAVATASNYAGAAANSASAAAQSALDAAAAVPENLVNRVEAVEARAQPATPETRGLGRVATLSDMAPGAPVANGPAFLAAGSDYRLPVSWIPGLFIGKIELLPFHAADLAGYCPGWHFCNGDQYALASPVGSRLHALPASFKADWGITVSGANISIPNMFHTDGRGYFARAVNGTARTVGSIEQDAMQGHRHGGSFASSTLSNGGGGSGWYNTASAAVVGDPITDNVNGGPRTSRETRSLNVGMTPAIFLDV